MDVSEVFYALPATNAKTTAAAAAAAALSTEMSLTPTTPSPPPPHTAIAGTLPSSPTPLPPTISTNYQQPTTPTTPRTTTHTPREIPTMYILDQMYDDYMDQYNVVNSITTPTETPEINASVQLAPCPICSRTFNPVTLRKHVGICEKMATKKRNIFDSSRQRREGTDLASYPLPKNYGLPEKVTSNTSVTVAAARGDRGQSPKPAAQQVSSPIMSRKKPTEDLIRSTARTSMRKAASTNNATPTATAAPAPAVTASTSSTNFTRDRMRSSERSLTRRGIQPPPAEQCPHCERCFGIKAYDRHVEWCKEKALLAAIKQGPSKNEGNVAKARLEARTKYRAPCLKTKRSINREKYSGLAGEEHENEENLSKCSKASGSNKQQDNSLMSMSMTSSMCSERIITTTGNINEQAAPSTSAAKHSIRSSSKGSCKCTRDRSQIRTQTPPTRNKKLNATATATSSSPLISTVSTAAASSVDAYKDEKSNKAIINFEIEMPEFYLMGEQQMTPNAINKKLIEKPTTATNTPKTKFDDHLSTMPKMKSKKPKQSPLQENNVEQQQQQRLSDVQLKEINTKFSRNLKIPSDIEIHFPEALTLICRNKKSPSDLSLKSSPPEICKTYETSNNDNQVHNEEVMITKAKETAENLDLSTSIIFYNSQQNTNDKVLSNKPAKKSKANTKNNPKINDVNEVNDDFKRDSLSNIESSQSKSTNTIQTKDITESMIREFEQFSTASSHDSFQTEFQLEDLIVKQSYPALLNDGELSDAISCKAMKLTKSQTSFSKKVSPKSNAVESAAVETAIKPRKLKTIRKHSPSSFSIASTTEFIKFQEDKDSTPRNSPLNSAKTDVQTSKTREKKRNNTALTMSRESVTEESSSVIEEEIIKSKRLKDSHKKHSPTFSKESTPEYTTIKEGGLKSRLTKSCSKEVTRKSSALTLTKENTRELLISSSEEESSPLAKCVYEEQTRKNLPENARDSVPKEHRRKSSTSTFTKENTSQSTAIDVEPRLCDNLCKESLCKNAKPSVSIESIPDSTLIESLITRKLKNKRNSYSTLSLFEESTSKPLKLKEESLKSRLLRSCSKEKTRKTSSSSSFYVESSVESTVIDKDSMKAKTLEGMVIEKIPLKSKTLKSSTRKNSASVCSEENALKSPVIGQEEVESGRRNTARENSVASQTPVIGQEVESGRKNTASENSVSLCSEENALQSSVIGQEEVESERRKNACQNSVYLSSKESTPAATTVKSVMSDNSSTDLMKSDPFGSTFSNEHTTDPTSTSVQKGPLKTKRTSRNRVSKFDKNLLENLTNLEEDITTEKEIFKDCLTDSDELRKVRSLESVELVEETHDTQLTLDNEANILKNSLKSETFIKDLENEDQNNVRNTPKDLNIPEADNNNEAEEHKIITTSNTNIKYIPNILKPLKLTRIPSPPPKQCRTPIPSIPNSLHQVEVNRLKSLNICQPKRKKVLRPSVSCTSALPLKAIPFSNEDGCVDIYNVASAPQMKTKREEDTTVPPVMLDIDEQKINIEEEEETETATAVMLDKEIKVIKEPPPLPPPTQLKRNRSFTVRGLPDNYDPFLSAKRQLEELCSPMPDNSDTTTTSTTSHTPQMPSLPTTPSTNAMTTSLILSSSTPNTTPNLMSTSQIPQQTQKTPILARSSSFRRTASLRGPRRSPLLASRPPLFAQKHRPTIQRGLSDEGPISTNFLKPEEYDEMPVRSVCVNDFALNKSPRVVRRDTSASNRKQSALKLNINAANAGNSSSATCSPNIIESKQTSLSANATSKYVSKTDSLAVFLKYEHELEKLNQTAGVNDLKKEIMEDSKTSPSLTNLDGPLLNAKELKDKSNNLSKQNSAKNIKADFLEHNNSGENPADIKSSSTEHNIDLETTTKYGQVRLAPLQSKPSTPLTKPSTPLTTNKPTTPHQTQQQQQPSICPVAMPLSLENQKTPKSPKPVALSSLFGSDNKTITTNKQTSSIHSNSNLLYTDQQNSTGSDYIDPKLINKCDNLPINLNLKRLDFKHSDPEASERRVEHFSSSSSESSAPPNNSNNNNKTTTSLPLHQTKFLPSVKQQQQQHIQQQEQDSQQQQQRQNHTSTSVTNSQRNSAEGRNLLKRRIRLGRNQFLYDASPEGDSCSADDEGANRSSMECENIHQSILREHEKAFERLSSAQHQQQPPPPPLIDTPSFMPPLSAFDDFDFEEFLSSFENDDEQFPIFKDCREFLLNRSSKKQQRSMLTTNSLALQNTNSSTNTSNNNNSTNFKKSPSPQQTFPPLTPQTHHSTTPQHFQFPTLPQHPSKNLFNSFSHNTRTRNKYDEELSNAKSSDTFTVQSNADDEYKEIESHHQQKREIFISIETEQNDLDKSPISPNSIRNMVGNPQTVVEVEVDAAHDNKFSKISDDDTDNVQSICRTKNYPHHHLEHLPNVQLNNAKNLRQMADEMSENLRQTMERRTAPVDVNMNSHAKMPTATRHVMAKVSSNNRSTGIPSGDAYADSDELSSLDGYPLSSPNSRLGVSSKTSADSAYGSLSRQRSSELTSQRSSSRSRPMASTTAHTVLSRPLAEESALARSRQLSASSSSSSEHNLPPISKSNSYHKQQQQQQQQQHLYNNNNNNNNNNSNSNNNNDLDEFMRYERNNNNNNTYDMQSANSQSNLESLQQYNTSNSTMSTSMKMSRFCHECGSKFLLEQAKFCMDCGVKRLIL